MKACKNVELILSTQYGNEISNAYSVLFGYHDNNDYTSVNLDITSDTVHQFYTPGIVDCDAYKALWVSWADERVTFGHGN